METGAMILFPSSAQRAAPLNEAAGDAALMAPPSVGGAVPAIAAASLRARFRDLAVMTLVAALSLGLLAYVALGEANRTYPRFVIEKMNAQGALVQSALEGLLRAGLPLTQLPGFERMADSIRSSDPDLAAIVARDAGGELAFSVGDAEAFAVGAQDGLGAHAQDGWLWVTLPLRSRFETVGSLTVASPQAAIDRAVMAWARPVGAAVAALGAAFCLFAAVTGGLAPARRWRLAGLAYGVCFALATAAVVTVLVELYAEGAQARARALTETLAQRISSLLDYGLRLDDVSGLDAMLSQYRALNPDIIAAGVMLEGVVAAHSEAGAVGAPWVSPPGAYVYATHVGASGAVTVAVSLPSDIVWWAAARSIKNFAALSISSALLAALFFGVARALGAQAPGAPSPAGGDARRLALARPILFVAVFAESLSAGFLPQVLREAAMAAGLGAQATSLAFTAYFATFMLALLLATAWLDRFGAQALMVAGALMIAASGAVAAVAPEFTALAVARAAAGLGQGVLFVGAQAAVNAFAPPGQRTTAAAIMVFGFSGGMISGAAIGALLSQDIGAAGVFASGAATALALAFYVGATLGATQTASRAAPGGLGRLARAAPLALTSRRFLGALLLIGAPSKAVMTGVVAFAAPLMLVERGWSAEDVGQFVMLYGAGVLLASGPVSRAVDRAGDSRTALLTGALLSALALTAIGAPPPGPQWGPLWPQGWGDGLSADWAAAWRTVAAAGGAALLGIAHGCVNAPVVSYVGAAQTAGAPDDPGAAALYRVSERIGHVGGPAIAGALILYTGDAGRGLVWLGVGVAGAALAFALLSGGRRR